ncbi:GlxA family transcriptional regulator [Undibacterium sp. TJN25]|uniref:GlxA family transcriptional regulator n=1 Tax=Undibacterium sp. TJN25 TaxID=3413056 RepID=UPI003BF0055C
MPVVALYICPHTVTSSLCMALDAFQLANQFHGKTLFQLRRVSADGKAVVTALGSLQVDTSLQRLGAVDIFIAPAIGRAVESAIAANAELLGYLRQQASMPAMQFVSLCSGAFLLGAAGLLDGRRATTHWALERAFRQRFPLARLSIDALLTQDGNMLCSGGAQAGLDLCLHLIIQHAGEALARQVANAMVVELGRSSQMPYAGTLAASDHGDALIARLQLWLDSHYAEEVTLESLAAMAHCSPRTLLRRFNSATGYSPGTYLQRLRVAAARDKLGRGNPQIEAVAAAVGYQDRPAFAKMFKRLTGQTPAAYKRQQQQARSRQGDATSP